MNDHEIPMTRAELVSRLRELHGKISYSKLAAIIVELDPPPLTAERKLELIAEAINGSVGQPIMLIRDILEGRAHG